MIFEPYSSCGLLEPKDLNSSSYPWDKEHIKDGVINIKRLYVLKMRNNSISIAKVFSNMLQLSFTSVVISSLMIIVGLCNILALFFGGINLLNPFLSLGLFIVGSTIFGTMFLTSK